MIWHSTPPQSIFGADAETDSGLDWERILWGLRVSFKDPQTDELLKTLDFEVYDPSTNLAGDNLRAALFEDQYLANSWVDGPSFMLTGYDDETGRLSNTEAVNLLNLAWKRDHKKRPGEPFGIEVDQDNIRSIFNRDSFLGDLDWEFYNYDDIIARFQQTRTARGGAADDYDEELRPGRVLQKLYDEFPSTNLGTTTWLSDLFLYGKNQIRIPSLNDYLLLDRALNFNRGPISEETSKRDQFLPIWQLEEMEKYYDLLEGDREWQFVVFNSLPEADYVNWQKYVSRQEKARATGKAVDAVALGRFDVPESEIVETIVNTAQRVAEYDQQDLWLNLLKTNQDFLSELKYERPDMVGSFEMDNGMNLRLLDNVDFETLAQTETGRNYNIRLRRALTTAKAVKSDIEAESALGGVADLGMTLGDTAVGDWSSEGIQRGWRFRSAGSATRYSLALNPSERTIDWWSDEAKARTFDEVTKSRTILDSPEALQIISDAWENPPAQRAYFRNIQGRKFVGSKRTFPKNHARQIAHLIRKRGAKVRVIPTGSNQENHRLFLSR